MPIIVSLISRRYAIDNRNEETNFEMGIQNPSIHFVNTVIFFVQSSPINNAIILDLFLFRFILAILFESLNSFHSLYFTGSFGPQSELGLKIYKKREIKVLYFSNSIILLFPFFFCFFILTSKQDFPSLCFNLLTIIQMGSWITPNPKSIQPDTET